MSSSGIKDAKTSDLLLEFQKFFVRQRKTDIESDRSRVFELWVCQKLAEIVLHFLDASSKEAPTRIEAVSDSSLRADVRALKAEVADLAARMKGFWDALDTSQKPVELLTGSSVCRVANISAWKRDELVRSGEFPLPVDSPEGKTGWLYTEVVEAMKKWPRNKSLLSGPEAKLT